MLTRAADTYLAVRRAAGFVLWCEGFQLKSFAAFSEARKQRYVSVETAIEWAGLAQASGRAAEPIGPIPPIRWRSRKQRYVSVETPIGWAGVAQSAPHRARRPG